MHDLLRHFVPDRPWHVVYAPPVAVAALDHGTSWITLCGLLIGVGGLTCHAIQTTLRVFEYREKRGKA
jgi:hypothetical protein